MLVGHSFGTVVAMRVARAAFAAGYDIAGVLLLAPSLTCPEASKHPVFGLPDCCLGCLQGSLSSDFAHRAYHPLSDPELAAISRSSSDRNPWHVIKPFYAAMKWGIHLGGTGKVDLRSHAELALDRAIATARGSEKARSNGSTGPGNTTPSRSGADGATGTY